MWEQVKKLHEILADDFQHYLSADTAQDQQRRRAIVRALCALVEGTTFALKQTALPKNNTDPHLTPEETAVVTESAIVVDDRGRTRRKPLFIRPATNVRFAFSLIARLQNVPFQLKTSGPGWKAFGDTIQVRNRLMHPKSAADLQVSDDDFDATMLGFRWFFAEFHLLMSYCSEAAAKKSFRLREETHRSTERARLTNEHTKALRERTEQLNDLHARLIEHARRTKELESSDSESKYVATYRTLEKARLLNEKAQLADEVMCAFEERVSFREVWAKRSEESNIAPFDDESLRKTIAEREAARQAATDALVEL
jgi:hypothetical protein